MKCSHCGFSQVIKAGKLRNGHVTKQGYRCKDCRHFFVERDGFENKSSNPGARGGGGLGVLIKERGRNRHIYGFGDRENYEK